MTALRFSDEQLRQLADMIADRLVARNASELIDAAELARRIGRTREFVYDHSAAFGAVRLGDGVRPRLQFRWPEVLDRLPQVHGQAEPNARPTNRPRGRRKAADLLPVRDGGGKRP